MHTFRLWTVLAVALLTAACGRRVERVGHVIDDSIGKAVELRGKAENAKGGAVLIIDEQTVYVKALAEWPANVVGKRVVVRGTLNREKYLPEATQNEKGEWTQGTVAGSTQTVVTPGDWEVEKLAPPPPK